MVERFRRGDAFALFALVRAAGLLAALRVVFLDDLRPPPTRSLWVRRKSAFFLLGRFAKVFAHKQFQMMPRSAYQS